MEFDPKDMKVKLVHVHGAKDLEQQLQSNVEHIELKISESPDEEVPELAELKSP